MNKHEFIIAGNSHVRGFKKFYRSTNPCFNMRVLCYPGRKIFDLVQHGLDYAISIRHEGFIGNITLIVQGGTPDIDDKEEMYSLESVMGQLDASRDLSRSTDVARTIFADMIPRKILFPKSAMNSYYTLVNDINCYIFYINQKQKINCFNHVFNGEDICSKNFNHDDVHLTKEAYDRGWSNYLDTIAKLVANGPRSAIFIMDRERILALEVRAMRAELKLANLAQEQLAALKDRLAIEDATLNLSMLSTSSKSS